MTDIPDYDDLKLRIEPGEGDSYRVVAFGPGGNTASGRFARPISRGRARQLHSESRPAAPARAQVPLVADGGGEAARHAAVREPLGRRRGRPLPRRPERGRQPQPRAAGDPLPDGRSRADGDPLGVPLRPGRRLLPLAVDVHAARALPRPADRVAAAEADAADEGAGHGERTAGISGTRRERRAREACARTRATDLARSGGAGVARIGHALRARPPRGRFGRAARDPLHRPRRLRRPHAGRHPGPRGQHGGSA